MVEVFRRYVQKFEGELTRFYMGSGKLLEGLDRCLSEERSRTIGHPSLSLAYLHRQPAHVSMGSICIPSDSREYQFVRLLNGNNGEEGLSRQIARTLPRQKGRARLNASLFWIDAKTILPKYEDKQDLRDSPVVSFVNIAVSSSYPENKKHNSLRARKDVSVIGARILNAGMNEGLVPFWAKADFGFKDAAHTYDLSINNTAFLEGLYSWYPRK